MKLIGLCGGSGSGKGALSRIFSEYGIPTVDTDAVYREITSQDSECMRELVREFGSAVALPSGALNREELRRAVFFAEDRDLSRQKLNKITHSFILDESRRRLSQYAKEGIEIAAIDAPLLFESGIDRECDVTVAVTSDREKRIERICRRDGISREAAEARINTQICDGELSRLADFTIVNNSSIEDLREKACELIAKIKQIN